MEDNESLILGIIRNIQSNRARKKLLQNIENSNELNRGLVRYQPSNIEAFFSEHDPIGNVIISGGVQALRNRAIIGSMITSVKNNVPVVIVHAGNQALEQLLHQYIPNLVVFNRQSAIYEPLIGLSTLEICRIVQSSATKRCEIRNGAQYYIEGITEFIRSKNIPPYSEMYISCPHIQLLDKVDEAEEKGYISASLAQQIKTNLVHGQLQRSDIENYFNVLRHQTQGLLCSKSNLHRAKSLRSVIKQGEIACIDISSPTNDLLLNLVLEDFNGALNNGARATLIVDGMIVAAGEKLEQYIRSSGVRSNLVISSEDLYPMLNGDDNLFASVVGKSIKSVVYKHTSGISCTKWAEVFGYYEKQEIKRTFTRGNHYQNMFSVVPGQMENDSIDISAKREYIVKPEEISRMNPNDVYIYDTVNNELAVTNVI